MLELIWKRKTGAYQNGCLGYLGAYPVFSVDWDSMRSKGSDVPPYILRCSLPGVKQVISNYATEALAQEKALAVVAFWLDRAGLAVKEVSDGE